MRPVAAFALLALALVSSGCASSRKNPAPWEGFDRGSAAVPLVLAGVAVVDGREEVDPRPFEWSDLRPAKTIAVHPPVTDEHRALIAAELERCFTGGGRPVTVVADVTAGQQTFTTGKEGVRVVAEFEVLLTFIDPATKRQRFQTSGGTAFRLGGKIASRKDADTFFKKAIRGAVHESMHRAAGAFR